MTGHCTTFFDVVPCHSCGLLTAANFLSFNVDQRPPRPQRFSGKFLEREGVRARGGDVVVVVVVVDDRRRSTEAVWSSNLNVHGFSSLVIFFRVALVTVRSVPVSQPTHVAFSRRVVARFRGSACRLFSPSLCAIVDAFLSPCPLLGEILGEIESISGRFQKDPNKLPPSLA